MRKYQKKVPVEACVACDLKYKRARIGGFDFE